MIGGPNERYQIATSAFHCILSGSLNESAYNTYSAGVMEIRIAGSSCRRPQSLFDQIYLVIITLGCDAPGGSTPIHYLYAGVCAAQRGRDCEAPYLERGIHFRGVF